MGRKRRNVQDDLPSSDRTREILLDKSGFLQDTKRLRTKLDEIHRAAIRSYRNGIVDPREIVPKTAQRIGITPDKNPRKYAILLMTVGIMSANLLQRTVQQQHRLFFTFCQLQEEKRVVSHQVPAPESRPLLDLRRYTRRERDHLHDRMMNFFGPAGFTPLVEQPVVENPLFPTFPEVRTAMAAPREFRYVAASQILMWQAEQLYEGMRKGFDTTGTLPDFETIRMERHLILSRQPLEYAIAWYCWHTTCDLQKKIAGEMKPVTDARENPACSDASAHPRTLMMKGEERNE